MQRRAFILVSLFALALIRPAVAETTDESFKYVQYHVDVVVNDDGTEKRRFATRMKVQREDALDAAKQQDITYSTNAEKVDVIEAYTLKAGRTRVDADRSGFQIESNGGRNGAPPAFSDQTRLTVVFPDVEVGDIVVLVYTLAVTDPLFPRQLSTVWGFPRETVNDDVRIDYSVPETLNFRYRNWGLTETRNKTVHGRRLLTWSFKNTAAKKSKYPAVPVLEYGDIPMLILSTFDSYKSIAQAYGARAAPKAAVTPEIKALADQIVKGKSPGREQAEALYDWERENLTYAGNCIGIGAVVPRDLDFVVKNKMGDCKDHATLLQALLKAEGIESTQALIGTGNYYKLPEVPIADAVNHVINYVPSLDLYLDAASGMPFGYLPKSLYDKPVLLVDGFREGASTPKIRVGVERASVGADVVIGDDGSMDGTTVIATSAPEQASRQAEIARKALTPKRLEEVSENLLKRSGYRGSVTLKPGVWNEKTMTYTAEIHYHLEEFVHLGTPGAIMPEPPFSPQTIAMMAGGMMQAANLKDAEPLTHGFVCADGTIEEHYRYTLPKSMRVLALPNAVAASNSVQDYKSEYSISGRALMIDRVMKDATPGPVCPPALYDEYLKLAGKVWPDMKSQIVYQ